MKLYLPIFLVSLLSLVGLETRAYAEQDTIIKYTNAVAPEYKVDFAISGDNPNTTFKANATTAEQASSSNTSAGGTISFPNGKKQEVAETPTSIEDKDGKIYAVDEQGKVTKAAEKNKATEKDNGGYYLNLIGGEENAVQEIYAILPNRQDTTKPSTIGKLIVAAYPRQEKNLMLVPVNGAKVDTAGVLKKINEIYNPVNVYWKINIAENFNNTSWDTDKDDALNVTGSKWYTSYTEEMKALKTAYSQTNNIDQRTLYMFVMKKPKTDNETSSKTIVGDMPRGKQFGFLFTEGVSNKEQLAKTIAHELGHGYFQLKHPFEMGLKQGDLKDNLMDYDQGVAFNKYEWDLMHDPGIVTGLFESDTSGQMSMLDGYSVDFEIGEQTSLPYQIFISPAGKSVLIEGNVIPLFNPTIEGIKVPVGALTDFLLTTNGQPIWYQGHIENGQFLGYRREINNDYVYYSDINGKYKNIIERIANKDESVLQELKITQFSALPVLVGGTTTDIEALIAKEIISKGGNILRRGAIIGRIGLVVGAIWELFTMPSYVEHIGQGTLVLELPFAQATTTGEYLKNPPASIPTAIPHKVPQDNGSCKVYVIWKINAEGTTDVAKYGMTCTDDYEDECNMRPEKQCQKFTREDTHSSGCSARQPEVKIKQDISCLYCKFQMRNIWNSNDYSQIII